MSKTLEQGIKELLGLEEDEKEWIGRDGNKYKFVATEILGVYKDDISGGVFLNENLEDIKPRWRPRMETKT